MLTNVIFKGDRALLRLLLSVSLLFCLFATNASARDLDLTESKLSFGLITQRSSDDAFWGMSERFMQKACDQLGIELHIFHVNFSRNKMFDIVDEAHLMKLDALIFPNLKSSAVDIIKKANKLKLPVFLFNAGLIEEEFYEVGKPQSAYPYFLGSMLPDDFHAGYHLAKELIQLARAQEFYDENDIVNIVAVAGTFSETASINRVNGLLAAVNEFPRVKLKQIAYGLWDKDRAVNIAKGFQERYPNATVYWSASDLMASGVIEGLNDLDLHPNKDFITGGVDWAEVGLKGVENSTIELSVGGHFMEAAWVAIMLYDHFHGIPLSNTEMTMVTPMIIANDNNIEQVKTLMNEDSWGDIDFKEMSKYWNKSLKTYSFSPANHLKEF